MCIRQCTGLHLWTTSVFSIVVLLQHIDIQLSLTLTNALVAESQGSQPLQPKPGSAHDPVPYPFTHNYNHTQALNPYARFTVILHILFTSYINVDMLNKGYIGVEIPWYLLQVESVCSWVLHWVTGSRYDCWSHSDAHILSHGTQTPTRIQK